MHVQFLVVVGSNVMVNLYLTPFYDIRLFILNSLID